MGSESKQVGHSSVVPYSALRLDVLERESIRSRRRVSSLQGHIGLGFHGFYWILISYLILRSTFLPRFLSALTAIAGLCWLTFLSPTLTNYLSPYVMASAFLVEGSVFLWLLVMGLNAPKWEEKANRLAIAA